VVEVLRRYSNRADLVDHMIDLLRRIQDHDRTDEPGLSSDRAGMTRRLLSDEQRRELVDGFRRGMKIKILANKFAVSVSCVNRTLRKYGVGRRERYA
jgi:hypothetical protein